MQAPRPPPPQGRTTGHGFPHRRGNCPPPPNTAPTAIRHVGRDGSAHRNRHASSGKDHARRPRVPRQCRHPDADTPPPVPATPTPTCIAPTRAPRKSARSSGCIADRLSDPVAGPAGCDHARSGPRHAARVATMSVARAPARRVPPGNAMLIVAKLPGPPHACQRARPGLASAAPGRCAPLPTTAHDLPWLR